MPGNTSYVRMGDNKSSQKLLQSVQSGRSHFLFAVMADPQIREAPEKFFRTGVVAEAKSEPGSPSVVLKGLFRAEMISLKRFGGDGWSLWAVTSKMVEDENCDDYFVQSHQNVLADLIKMRDLLRSFLNRSNGDYDFEERPLMENLVDNFENFDWGDKDFVDYFIWSVLAIVPDLLQKDKQPFIESTSLLERIDLCIKTLKTRLKFLEIQTQSISKEDRPIKKVGRVQAKDSGNHDSSNQNKDSEDKDFEDLIKSSHRDIQKRWNKFKGIRDHMNENAREVVMEDIRILLSLGDPQSNTHEWPKYMGRLEFLLSLPWKEETPQESDISKVVQVLDEDHYGLTYVKDAICDQLAPKLLNPEGRGYILCLVGPPGVGKTSLAKSVARALGRKYIRMSLGGVKDEAQIRGHKITYIGSEAGEILKDMKRCGVKNPVFVIDEIDKLGHMSVSGDPSSAMLEVFDPEQNNTFKDHYVACGFDLSKVMFIATANVESDIIPPLRDRMDIIRLPGYLEVEKIEIAKRYLVARWMNETGLSQNNVEVQWEDGLFSDLIRGYTSEAGVRNLERIIATILRKVSREFLKSRAEDKPLTNFIVTKERMHDYLGPPKYFKDRVRSTMIGEAIGLAWTPVGGDLLYVQAELYDKIDNKKVLDLTGMQGDVMKESDKLALTRLRNILRETNPTLADKLRDSAIHLHFPEGAVSKDGPSAGIAILCALYSEVTGTLIKQNLAMTGEIDNKGRVLPVGGIREKIVAAERAGIKEIIMPKDNERSLHDVPQAVKERLKFNFVESVDEVLEIAFPKPA
ncbi:MAG: Lon protease [Candidatus Yanofskybacteria bacterium GW2011_GWA1_39_13]|uniref:Lon protease n=1 Tax=Yanofskybacteria sp. (strain GW2011_GWA1_39_13) TaxID=1619019 RepID=A0A0G0MF50_YANXG|nr:MAG: Lon protease [Candidatus Yanofskybacteria bacterium GW2011_GWA1_39_13]